MSSENIELIIDDPSNFSVTLEPHPGHRAPCTLAELVKAKNTDPASMLCGSLMNIFYDPEQADSFLHHCYGQLVGKSDDVSPLVGVIPETRGDRIGEPHIRVAGDFEGSSIVVGKERQEIPAHDVIAEIGRDVTDFQAAFGVAVVGMPGDEVGQWLRVLDVPLPMFYGNRRGVETGVEVRGVDEVAVGLRVTWAQGDGATAGGDRFVELADIAQGHPQAAPRLGIIRPKIDGFAECGDGFVHLPFVPEGNAEIAMRLGVVVPKRDGTTAACDRFVQLPLVGQCATEIALGLGVRGAEGDRPSIGRDRVVEPAHFAQGDAKAVVSLNVTGPLGDRLAIRDDRVGQSTAVSQGITEIAVGLREIGPERDGLAMGRERFVQATGISERDAKVGVGLGEIGPKGDGLPVRGDASSRWPASLSATPRLVPASG